MPSNYLTSAADDIYLYRNLCNQSLYHRITGDDPTSNNVMEGRYTQQKFRGIIIDTGAATNSTAGYDQVKAYLRQFDGKINFSTAGAVKAYFGVGQSTSIGTINIKKPIGNVTCEGLGFELLRKN